MKKSGNCFMLTVWWFILLAVAGCLTVFFTPDGERISKEENRVLQNRPEMTFDSVLSGDYSTAFDAFLSDSVPSRKWLTAASESVVGLLSFNTADDLAVMDTTEQEVEDFSRENLSDSDLPPEEDAEEETAPEDTVSSDEQDEEGTFFGFIYKNGRVNKQRTYDKKAMARSARTLDLCASLLPEDGKVYFTTVTFPVVVRRLSNNLDTYTGWKSTLFDRMNQLTSDKVVCVDPYAILEPHLLQGEKLFLHTNHQWSDLGAYYIFSEMIRQQGLTPTPYEEYEYDSNRAYYAGGTEYDLYNLLYPLAPASNWSVSKSGKKSPLPFMEYHKPHILSYLYGSHVPWKTVETGFNTGRNALVLGDCYTLPFTPFLLPYYDTVHYTRLKEGIFDQKKLGASVAELIERKNITDIYYLASESGGVNSQTLQYFVAKNLMEGKPEN